MAALDFKGMPYDSAKMRLSSNTLDAPTIFADDIRTVFITNGVAKISLIQIRVDAPSDEVVAVPIAILMIPEGSLRGWGTALIEMADEWDANIKARQENADKA